LCNKIKRVEIHIHRVVSVRLAEALQPLVPPRIVDWRHVTRGIKRIARELDIGVGIDQRIAKATALGNRSQGSS
jgi:hypothetical protein